MKKINAYTLMEVTIAMLLSAICITICYTAFGIISGYYNNFHQKQAIAGDVTAIRQVLERDFLKSRYVLRTTDGLELIQQPDNIYYTFNEKQILREIKGLHTDTFTVAPTALFFGFEDQEILEPDTIDKVSFRFFLDAKTGVSVQVNKQYSAADLFK